VPPNPLIESLRERHVREYRTLDFKRELKVTDCTAAVPTRPKRD
jgi:hypothetical protein